MIFISSCGLTSQPCWSVHWNSYKICIKQLNELQCKKETHQKTNKMLSEIYLTTITITGSNMICGSLKAWVCNCKACMSGSLGSMSQVLGNSNVDWWVLTTLFLVGQEPETKVQRFVACSKTGGSRKKSVPVHWEGEPCCQCNVYTPPLLLSSSTSAASSDMQSQCLLQITHALPSADWVSGPLCIPLPRPPRPNP
jgi:hypothetical protein